MSKNLEPLVKAVAFCLVILVLSGVAYFFYERTRNDYAALYREFEKKLNLTPQITINRTLVIQQSAPAMELVTHKRRLEQSILWTSTLLRSTKAVKLTGEVTASAGFNLQEPFSIEIDTAKKTILVRYPRPRLLSLQVDSIRTTEDPGYWNWITEENRNEALKRFTSEAGKEIVAHTPLLEEARQSLRAQFTEILKPYGMTILFEENAPAEKEPEQPLPPQLPLIPESPAQSGTPAAPAQP